MVKVRMNTADVAAEVKCLRRLIGMRCSNVYDISPKTYLFKLMNSSGITESGESEKVLLLMESGVRLHTTAYVRDKNTTPSGFTLKLRKHIRTRRLEDVRQLGYDRIILFQFGLGANSHYIILELYAQGNIILTDADFVIMTLLRSHRDDDKGLAIMSRHKYPIEACRVFERTSAEKLQTSLASQFHFPDNSIKTEAETYDVPKKQGGDKKKLPDSKKKTGDGGKSNRSTLKVILGDALAYGPALSEHIILDAGLLPNVKIGNGTDVKVVDGMIQPLVNAVNRFEDWLTDVISGQKTPEGYILMQSKVTGKKENSVLDVSSDEVHVYDEFCPILLNQFRSRQSLKFETFDAALDEFYSKIESQRAEQQQKAKEDNAMQKLDKIRSDQENRVLTLKREVDHCQGMAELIEYNLEDVDSAILAVRVAIANGMNWDDLARMVKEEKKSGNPVAGLIDKLYLERNSITLLLSNNLDEMDDEEKTRPADKVEVDLALSAHANARRWYEMKKKQETKQEKTVTAHEKAFKAAERKTRVQLAQANSLQFSSYTWFQETKSIPDECAIRAIDCFPAYHFQLCICEIAITFQTANDRKIPISLPEKTVAAITHMRKVHWFEKFNWFISSENYLVVSGRDAQQNEMIVKRYMSKGDLYVHADLHGASSTVVKNHKPELPVPPLTLNQAGCYTVCQSQAWNSKIVTSAWWVYPHQVSKTAPTGEYLTVGSFMIRGKKNFLPPHPLIMGFGILFRLDESSLALHLNERRVKGEDEETPNPGEGDVLNEQTESDSEDSDEQNCHLGASNSETRFDGLDMPNIIDMPTSNSEIVGAHEYFCGDTADSTRKNHQISCFDDTEELAETSISSQLEDLIDTALELGPSKLLGRNLDVSAQPHTSNLEESIGASRDRPYISKAERRKFKKGQKNTGESATDVGEHDQKKQSNSFEDPLERNAAKSVAPKTSRGQRGKLKKIKEKYAEQDDEERSIRMALLASAGRPVKNEKKIKDAATSNSVKSAPGPIVSAKICYKCKKPGHLSKDCREHTTEVNELETALNNADRNGLEDLHDRELHPAPSELDRITMEEDDIHEIGEEEKGKLNDIDYLTGNPLPNDILLYCVPVCGPYNALQTYKYRVKITPGNAKKGKAAKTAMNLFGHMPEATGREKELMKACTESELVAVIIGNARITAPGLTQLKQKQKKGKKLNRQT